MPRRLRAPAHRDEQLLRGDLGAVVELHGDAVVAVLADLGRLTAQVDRRRPPSPAGAGTGLAVRLSMPASRRGRISTTVIWVPSGGEEAGELAADDAAADHDHALGHGLEHAGCRWRSGPPGGPCRSPAARRARCRRTRPGGRRGSRSPSTTTASPSTRPSPRTTVTPLRLAAPSTPCRILRTTSSLRSIMLREVERDLRDDQPVLVGAPDPAQQVGRRQERLRGDAAPVEAGPAELRALDQRRRAPPAAPRAAPRRRRPGRRPAPRRGLPSPSSSALLDSRSLAAEGCGESRSCSAWWACG